MVNQIRWREAAVERLLNTKGGAVGRYMSVQGQKISTLARSKAGGNTGALKASIHVTKRGRYVAGQFIRVGSNLPYARLHHQGTKPRVIVPQKRRVLRFFVKGVAIFTPVVMHPGTSPNRYLTDAMRAVIR